MYHGRPAGVMYQAHNFKHVNTIVPKYFCIPYLTEGSQKFRQTKGQSVGQLKPNNCSSTITISMFVIKYTNAYEMIGYYPQIN